MPVRLRDPNATCQWRFFDDDLESPQGPVFKGGQPCSTTVSDGGVIIQEVSYGQPTDGHCHRLTFAVAHGFSPGELDVPDNIGGDNANWDFLPPGCNFYDAGAFQDGAFPVDAGTDGLPVTPESGPIPDSGGDP